MSLKEIEALISQVYIVGAGPGDPDLLTVKAQKLLAAADVILFADSLVPNQILEGVRADAEVIQTADKTPHQALLYGGQSATVPVITDGSIVFQGAVSALGGKTANFEIPFDSIKGWGVHCCLPSVARRVRFKCCPPNP